MRMALRAAGFQNRVPAVKGANKATRTSLVLQKNAVLGHRLRGFPRFRETRKGAAVAVVRCFPPPSDLRIGVAKHLSPPCAQPRPDTASSATAKIRA